MKLPKNPKKIFSYWLLEWPVCLLIAITGIVYNAGMIVFPFFQGYLIDVIGVAAPMEIVRIVLIYLGIILLVQISRAMKRYTVRLFASDTLFRMRGVLYSNLLSEEKKRTESLGTMLSHCFGDLDQCVEGMRKLTTEVFDTVFLFLFYIAYLFFYDTKITSFVLIPVFLAILLSFLLRHYVFRLSSETRKVSASLVAEHYDYFSHALLFRTYAREQDFLQSYEKSLEDYETKNRRSLSMTDVMIPISNMVALFGILPIVFLGIPLVLKEAPIAVPLPFFKPTWTKGTLTTYLSTFVLLASKASHTAKLFFSVEKGLSSWKRVVPYLNPVKAPEQPIVREGEKLVISDMTLKTAERTLIQNLNLSLKKGEILGVTGEVSTGKSAFGRIFIKQIPYEGSVLLFSKEIRDYTFGEIKGDVTYLGHRLELLTTTISENILLGEENEVAPFLSSVSFEEDLKTMPAKENTIIGNEGVRLSGGEQERIALARTFAHKKPLVILDDPFASLDKKTELEIQTGLRERFSDSIVLLMSHRLSCFPKLDHILVLHGDGSYSYGTHEELMRDDEQYRHLYELQMGGIEA